MPTWVHHKAALDGSPYPPNSLEAIRACLEADAAFIEVDIKALADGDYLLVHNDSLDEETTGAGAVNACTTDAARQLHIRQAGRATSFHVPLLSEVVAAFAASSAPTQLQLDFKDYIPADDELLLRLIKLIEPLGARVIVSSIADWQLRRLKRLAPALAVGFDIQLYLDWTRETAREPHEPHEPPRARGIYGYWDDQPQAAFDTWLAAHYLRDRCEVLAGLVPGVRAFYVRHQLLARSLRDGFNWAAALHEHGILLDAWTMDATNAEAMENLPTLVEAGIDYITTNTPLALKSQHTKR